MVPATMYTGKRDLPQLGETVVLTFRVGNATLTVLLTPEDAHTWADQIHKEADGPVRTLTPVSPGVDLSALGKFLSPNGKPQVP